MKISRRYCTEFKFLIFLFAYKSVIYLNIFAHFCSMTPRFRIIVKEIKELSNKWVPNRYVPCLRDKATTITNKPYNNSLITRILQIK